MREPPDDESVRRIERVELLIRRLGAAGTMEDAAALIAGSCPMSRAAGRRPCSRPAADGRSRRRSRAALVAQSEGSARPADHWSTVRAPAPRR